MNFSVAVPALVNCAIPKRWISAQATALASQKFTRPGVTGVVPVRTVAVRITAVPEFTVVTEAAPDVTARVVVVCGGAGEMRSADAVEAMH
jgi:hypothetical protein